jgi:ribosomal-protein-alanine acetyltransferase
MASAATRIQLRAARATDLDEVVAIERVSFSEPPWSRASFAALIGDPRVQFLVAYEGDDNAQGRERVLGYAVTWVVADEAELANLAVAPHRRRAGIGHHLLAAAIAHAESVGVAKIYLEVRASNVSARRLYKAHGFNRVGRRPLYYRNPSEDALVLRLEMGRRMEKR